MQLFKSGGETPSAQMPFWQGLKAYWLGETRPQIMAAALLVLVALLHTELALWLLQAANKPSLPKEKLIEVTLAAAPVVKPAPAKPQAPAPVAKPIEKKLPVPPKVVKPKTVAKVKPLEKQPAPKPVAELSKPAPTPLPPPVAVPAPSAAPVAAKAESAPAASTAPPSSQTQTRSAATDGITAKPGGADAKATCVQCPKPKYPRAAQRRNLEGTVQVKLVLSADGSVTDVTILKSSGHTVLDEAAVNDVRSWRFNAVASTALRTATQTINFKM